MRTAKRYFCEDFKLTPVLIATIQSHFSKNSYGNFRNLINAIKKQSHAANVDFKLSECGRILREDGFHPISAKECTGLPKSFTPSVELNNKFVAVKAKTVIRLFLLLLKNGQLTTTEIQRHLKIESRQAEKTIKHVLELANSEVCGLSLTSRVGLIDRVGLSRYVAPNFDEIDFNGIETTKIGIFHTEQAKK